MRLFALVTTYSFDTDIPVRLFLSEQDAFKALKQLFDEEIRIETEENGHALGVDMTAELDTNALTGTNTITFPDTVNTVTWTVTEINTELGIDPKDLIPRGILVSDIDWCIDQDDMTDEEYTNTLENLPLPKNTIVTPEMLGDKDVINDTLDVLSDKYEFCIETGNLNAGNSEIMDLSAIKMQLRLLRSKLTADDCVEIFNILKSATPVIGGKIWTDNDIASELRKTAFSDSQDNIDAVYNYIDCTNILNNTTNEEWNVIHNAIEAAKEVYLPDGRFTSEPVSNQ